jgi:hypothetical protein
MIFYRVYYLTSESTLKRAFTIECSNDTEAMAWLSKNAPREWCELWEGDRKVGETRPQP